MGATGEGWKGEDLEEWMKRAGDWAETGNRSRYIAEAMIHAPKMLSYTKDPDTGEITWFPDLSGDVTMSRDGDNLVFTARQAVESGFEQERNIEHGDLAALPVSGPKLCQSIHDRDAHAATAHPGSGFRSSRIAAAARDL